jgi:membrane-associated phospholipid phosphatase
VGATRRTRAAAELIPRSWRRYVTPVVLLGATLVAVLAVRHVGARHAGPLDALLVGLVRMRHGVVAVVGEALADLGDPIPVAVLMTALVAAAWWWRGGRGLAVALVAPSIAMITTSAVLKPLVQRTKDGSLAFPSGHTTAVASLALTAAVLVLGTPGLVAGVRWLLTAVLGVLVLAVGVCMVGRGYHYPTDVLGALGVVVTVVPLAALVVDAFAALGDDGHPGEGSDVPDGRLAAADDPTRRIPVVR